jgi:hypothetical protein
MVGALMLKSTIIPFELHVAKMWGKRHKSASQEGLHDGQGKSQQVR